MISSTERMSLLKEEMKLLRKQQREEKKKNIDNLISGVGSILLTKAKVNIKKEEEILELIEYLTNAKNEESSFIFDNEKYEKYREERKKQTVKKSRKESK